MARLDVPHGPGGDAAMIWTLRPELGGMVERMIRGAYQQSILPADERELFTDAEILDLTLCVAVFLSLGRSLAVLGVDQSCAMDM